MSTKPITSFPWSGRPVQDVLPARLGSLLMITVHPDRLARPVLAQMKHVIGIGDDVDTIATAFASRARRYRAGRTANAGRPRPMGMSLHA